MSSSVLPLPASYKFGRVVCRILQGVSDSPLDADHLPEARPASGTITFTPTKSVIKDFGRSPAIVGHGAYKYFLHSETGELVDQSTENTPSTLEDLGEGEFARLVPGAGVWLFEGVWNVKFDLGSISVPSFPINIVAANHTASTPMDLVTEMPYITEPGVTNSLVELPPGRVKGRVLGISDTGQVAWIAASGGTGGSSSWADIPGRPTVVASGSTTTEARLSIAATSEADVIALIESQSPPTPDLTGLVTNTDLRLSDTRDPNPHEHAIADTVGLEAALSAKQPSGNYATAAQGAKADSAVQFADLTKASVGLDKADNTPDANKPVSDATQAALDAKANASSLDTKANSAPGATGTFCGVWTPGSAPAVPAGTGPFYGFEVVP